MKPNVFLHLYKARIKSNGKYPLKVRVVYLREYHDYKTGIDLTEEEFISIRKPNPPKKLRGVAQSLNNIETKYLSIIKNLNIFTFERFEEMFHGNIKDQSNIYPFFDDYISELKAEGRIKTAISYNTTMNAFKRFHKEKLAFYDITPSFLRRFDKWMEEKGKSSSTTGIYIRSLRTIYNLGINKKVISKEEYPFGKGKYVIPASRNVKKALTLGEISAFYNYQTVPGSSEDMAKDFWMFSYLCSGINFKDIATLKWRNIDGDMLRFIRAKTKRANQGNQIIISCFLTPRAKEILYKWSNKLTQEDEYIFKILSKDDTQEKQMKKIDQFIKNTNKYTKRISKSLGIDKNVTTYFSRHSAATILKRTGASPMEIQESLGHQNLATTMKYLDSFDDNLKVDLANSLNNF